MSPYADPDIRKIKQLEYARAYYARNPDRVKDRRRRSYAGLTDKEKRDRVLNRYGITMNDYEALLLSQGNACAICRTEAPGGRFGVFHVDHCHETGFVRGLLCHKCNCGIGLFNESVATLVATIEYLAQDRGGTK